LKAEESLLKEQAAAVAALKDDNQRLQQQLAPAPMTPAEAKEQAIAKMNFGRQWLVGFLIFADQHGGQFPTNFAEAMNAMEEDSWKTSGVTTNQFEIVYQGALNAITNPARTIVLREIEAAPTPGGADSEVGWVKAYGFADGHMEVRREEQNNFDDFESAHIVGPPEASTDGQPQE
jgi:hypothetical protein